MVKKEPANQSKEADPFRDGYLRYLGYANEVGEAFRPRISCQFVYASYAVATAYVIADTINQGKIAYDKGADTKAIAIKVGDVLTWQTFASIIIPGFTINRITWATGFWINKIGAPKNVRQIVPTAVGLLSIPLIIKPIDRFVDFIMDETYRKFLSQPN